MSGKRSGGNLAKNARALDAAVRAGMPDDVTRPLANKVAKARVNNRRKINRTVKPKARRLLG